MPWAQVARAAAAVVEAARIGVRLFGPMLSPLCAGYSDIWPPGAASNHYFTHLIPLSHPRPCIADAGRTSRAMLAGLFWGELDWKRGCYYIAVAFSSRFSSSLDPRRRPRLGGFLSS